MNKRYLMALDQGTTSSRAVIFTFEGAVVASAACDILYVECDDDWCVA